MEKKANFKESTAGNWVIELMKSLSGKETT